MLKTIVTAIVSALTAHIITKHRADKNVVILHRSYDRKLDTTRWDAFARGWSEGHEQGYRTGHTDGFNGNWDNYRPVD